MNRFFLLLLPVLLALSPLPAQAQDTTLVRLLRTNAYPLTAKGAQLSGPGWNQLQASIAKSQFVLVGEQHGTAEVPQFTQAVAQVQQPVAFITEIDRYQARSLTALTAQPGFPTAYCKATPMALSFFSWTAEYELARQLRAQHTRLIGIDQVSFLGVGRFYQELAGQVRIPPARTYLLRQGAGFQARNLACYRSGAGGFSMFVQSAVSLDSLRTIAKAESPAVRHMVDDYLLSCRVYQGSGPNGAASHQQRVNLMKRNLLEELRSLQAGGQPLPKLLFKFGANHMARAISPWSGITDVGNLALNLADVQDAKSLHLLVMGREGSQNNGFNPDDASKNVENYKLDDADFKPFVDLAPGPDWRVFDLRPARRALLSGKLTLSNQALANLLLGYDYFVLVAATTASHG